ncbi:hypothetical protein VPH35_066785 [Triticum aestivum]
MTTVLRLGELLEQVLLRVDGLKSLLRSSTLSREWLSIASRKEFRQQFMANHDPPLLGIILQFAVVGTDWRHLEFAPVEGLDQALAPKASEVAAALAGQASYEMVLACVAVELVMRERESPRGYAKRTILGPVSASRHRLPRDNIIEAIPSAICACFVVIDGEKPFFDGYHQTHAKAGGELGAFHLRVTMDRGDRWFVEVSEPIFSKKPCIPHDDPCAIVVDGVLYMMYVVGFLFSYDLASRKFGMAKLPAAFSNAKDMDYMMARSGQSGICILLRRGGVLENWTCTMKARSYDWQLHASHNLKLIFDGYIVSSFWDVAGGGGDFFSMKIRAVGRNGSYAIITFGFCPHIFLVDTMSGRAMKIGHVMNPNVVTMVTPVCMPWPRSFTRL